MYYGDVIRELDDRDVHLVHDLPIKKTMAIKRVYIYTCIYIYIHIYTYIYIYIYIWRWVKTNYIVSFSGMNSHLPALPAMTWGSRHGTRAVLTFRHVVFFGIAEIPSGKLTVCY